MSEVSYPKKYQNILVKAGLIGSGVKIISAYHNDKKRLTMDEESKTWFEMDEYEIDYREAEERIAPYVDGTNNIAGDWRKGLTADEVKIVADECRVRVFEQNTQIRIYHGKRFDLTNPVDMAEYRIIMETNVLGLSKDSLAPGQRFYVSSHEDEMFARQQKRNALRESIQMAERMSDAEKRDLLKLLNYELKLGLSGKMSEEDVRDNFNELAYNGKTAEDVFRVYRYSDKNLRLLLHECVDNNILFVEGDRGAVSKPNGHIIGADWEEALDALKTDQGLRAECRRKRPGNDAPVRKAEKLANDALELGTVNTYDTTIEDIADIRFWNVEACTQYLKEHGVTHTLTTTDGAEKWRKLVEETHLGPKKPNRERLLERIKDDWTRDQCKGFWKTAPTQLVPPQGNHSTEEWRRATCELVNALTDEQLAEL